MPKPQSDLAQQTLKDPYVFDFLAMRKDYDERELETALVSHVTHFLLELGAGFSLYKLTHKLPRNLKSSLPTIEEIEKEFSQTRKNKKQRA